MANKKLNAARNIAPIPAELWFVELRGTFRDTQAREATLELTIYRSEAKSRDEAIVCAIKVAILLAPSADWRLSRVLGN